jgi:predicted TIM-barrel fold metal-dependent hydrolase
LRRLVEAGFEDRIMYGSDQMAWPEFIAPSVEAIEEADFLTEEQKRKILYFNAVHFFRLEEDPPGQ